MIFQAVLSAPKIGITAAEKCNRYAVCLNYDAVMQPVGVYRIENSSSRLFRHRCENPITGIKAGIYDRLRQVFVLPIGTLGHVNPNDPVRMTIQDFKVKTISYARRTLRRKIPSILRLNFTSRIKKYLAVFICLY